MYGTVDAAITDNPRIDASLVYVLQASTKDAPFGAIRAGVETVPIITKQVSVRDADEIHQCADREGVTVGGPTSMGSISPGA